MGEIFQFLLRFLTCTLCAGDEGGSRWASATLTGSGQQNFDLILHIGVQVPQLVGGGIHNVGLGPVAGGGAVFHFLQDDGPIADDGVGIGLDPQVGGAYCKQFRGGDGSRWGWWGETSEVQMLLLDGCSESDRTSLSYTYMYRYIIRRKGQYKTAIYRRNAFYAKYYRLGRSER